MERLLRSCRSIIILLYRTKLSALLLQADTFYQFAQFNHKDFAVCREAFRCSTLVEVSRSILCGGRGLCYPLRLLTAPVACLIVRVMVWHYLLVLITESSIARAMVLRR